MQYFITKSNFIRITGRVKLDEEQVKQDIYKKKIFFFNRIEEKQILSVKQFLINAENGVYKFVEKGFIEDTFSFINEESRYAKYHLDSHCDGLLSTYRDYEIPIEIKYKVGESNIDKKRVEEFRNWFKLPEIEKLFTDSPKKFVDMLQMKFQLQNPPKPVEFSGKGAQRISNLSQNELEEKIDGLINQASEHYNRSEKIRTILVQHNFSKQTYWVTSKKYRSEPIKDNNTGYSDEDVREVLLEFYNKIKKPIIDYLIDYWIIRLNPGLNFDKNILEQLDFKPCNLCVNKYIFDSLEIDIDDSVEEIQPSKDDFPF